MALSVVVVAIVPPGDLKTFLCGTRLITTGEAKPVVSSLAEVMGLSVVVVVMTAVVITVAVVVRVTTYS